jgi:hypothetical protein
MVVDENKSRSRSEHERHAFYLGSAVCEAKFDNDPHKIWSSENRKILVATLPVCLNLV